MLPHLDGHIECVWVSALLTMGGVRNPPPALHSKPGVIPCEGLRADDSLGLLVEKLKGYRCAPTVNASTVSLPNGDVLSAGLQFFLVP